MSMKGQFHVPIYECDVIVTISGHAKDSLNYYLRKLNYEEHKEDFDGMIWRPNDRVGKYYVFFDDKGLDVNTYNHEKSHLIEWILKDRSISPQNEMRSYLDGFISKKMNDFFQRRKIKLK